MSQIMLEFLDDITKRRGGKNADQPQFDVDRRALVSTRAAGFCAGFKIISRKSRTGKEAGLAQDSAYDARRAYQSFERARVFDEAPRRQPMPAAHTNPVAASVAAVMKSAVSNRVSFQSLRICASSFGLSRSSMSSID